MARSLPDDTLYLVLAFVSDDVHHLSCARQVCSKWGMATAAAARHVCLSKTVDDIAQTIENLQLRWPRLLEVDLTFVAAGARGRSAPPDTVLERGQGEPFGGLMGVLRWCAARHLTVTALPRSLWLESPGLVHQYCVAAPECAIDLALRLIPCDRMGLLFHMHDFGPDDQLNTIFHSEAFIRAVFREGGPVIHGYCTLLFSAWNHPPPLCFVENVLVHDTVELLCHNQLMGHVAASTVPEAVCGALQFTKASFLSAIPHGHQTAVPDTLRRTLALRSNFASQALAKPPAARNHFRNTQLDVFPRSQLQSTGATLLVLWDQYIAPNVHPSNIGDVSATRFGFTRSRATPREGHRLWDAVAIELNSSSESSRCHEAEFLASEEVVRQAFAPGKHLRDLVMVVQKITAFDKHLASLTVAEHAFFAETLPELPRRTLLSGLSLLPTLCLISKEAMVRCEERCAYVEGLNAARAERPEEHWPRLYQSAVDRAQVARRRAYREPRFLRAMDGQWTAGLRDLQRGFEALIYGDVVWYFQQDEEEERFALEEEALEGFATEASRLSMIVYYYGQVAMKAAQESILDAEGPPAPEQALGVTADALSQLRPQSNSSEISNNNAEPDYHCIYRWVGERITGSF